MAWNHWHRWIVAGVAAFATCGTLRGEDESKEAKRVRLKSYAPSGDGRINVRYLTQEVAEESDKETAEALDPAELPRSSYWIGLSFQVPLPELVKEQLGIEHGLTVSHVLEGSPAAKAEFKANDILIKAGETPLQDPADLIRKVEEAKESAFEIVLLRGGKELSLKVTPAKRPEAAPADRSGLSIDIPAMPELRVEIRRLEDALKGLKSKVGEDGVELLFARPAVVGSPAYDYLKPHELPDNVQIQITRHGKEPAKIHVERDGKTWDVTDNKLGDLPPDLAAHVQQFLGHRQTLRLHALAPPMGAPGVGGSGPARVRARAEGQPMVDVVEVQPVPGTGPQAAFRWTQPVRPGGSDGVVEKLNIILKKLDDQDDGDALQRLSDEVQQLRKEVDELRKQAK